MKLKWVVLVIVAVPSSGTVLADGYDDCVLNGMKGISGDVAARAVIQSCKNKVAEAKRATFGTPLNENEFEFVSGNGSVQRHDGGYYSQVLRNKSSSKLVTYVALQIRDGDYFEFKGKSPKGEDDWKTKVTSAMDEMKWQDGRTHTYFYRLSVKPGNEVRLMFPSPTTGSFYSEITSILGRTTKWSDAVSISAFSGNIKPESLDPLK